MKRSSTRTTWTAAIGVAVALTASAAVAQDYTSPRFQSGELPSQQPLAPAGGVAVLEIEVAASGMAIGTRVLVDGPPFTEALSKATRLWSFRPATVDGSAVSSHVQLVGVFRPPTLYDGDARAPESEASRSDGVPFPRAIAMPAYPPQALWEGIALLEVEVGAEGAVREATLLSPEQGFDQSALDAVRELRFEPATYQGRPVPTHALVLFGYRQPVAPGVRPRP